MKTHCKLLSTFAVGALVAACGGGDGGGGETPAARSPQLKLSITATEDFPGSYGSVGAYERVTGTISGEVDPKDAKNAVIRIWRSRRSMPTAWSSTAPTSCCSSRRT